MIGRRAQASAQDGDKPMSFDDYDLRLGDIMRGERATIGKSLLDVQRELKIRATYVAAIENCDVAAFETQGFIAGYVRSYARYLGLDPEWAYQKFRNEAGFSVPDGMSAAAASKPGVARVAPVRDYHDPLANPSINFSPQRESFLGRLEPAALGSIAVLVALIAGIGFGGWTVVREIQKVQVAPIDRSPDVSAELDVIPAMRQAAADDVAEGADDIAMPGPDAFGRLYRPQPLDAPVMTARDGPISAIDPRRAQRGGVQGQEGAERVAGAMPVAPAMPQGFGGAAQDASGSGQGAEDGMTVSAQADAAPGEVQVVESQAPEVELMAVRPAWVRVSAADGTVLLEKTMESGERYTVPRTEDPPRLRTGNSGAVYFRIGDETYGPTAPGAQIASNIALSVEAVTADFDVADLSGDPDLREIIAVADAGED